MSPLLASPFLVLALAAAARPVTDPPYDKIAARLVAFPSTPIHPLAFSADGSVLYALNQPGARLEILDPATLARIRQVPIGLGAVSVVQRPNSAELWVVDSVESCVSVVDPALGAVVKTIRVGAEPHGLVFTPNGDRAYVTCSAAERVDVVSTSTYRIVKSLPIKAKSPRGIAYLNGKAYVASFLSGNGTAPRGLPSDPDAVETIGRPTSPSEQPLPDSDVFVIVTKLNPLQDRVDLSATASGVGTVLFNVHARPGTQQLWIPNTEALNADHRGQANFVAGQFVSNRITIVDASRRDPPQIIDLDAITPPDRKCAQPGYLEFDPVLPLVYVSGYGSDVVAVFRIGQGPSLTWEGSIELPSVGAYPRGTGPRACLLTPDRSAIVAYNRNDTSLSRIPLASLPSGTGWSFTAQPARSLGLDLSSGFVRLGRHLFSNARFSASQTTSCASCHVDGHTDGIAWDLSSYMDPEGTPDDQLRFPLDEKGPLVTQSVRRMEDSSPYHWRGEIASTNGFQQAFIDLFEHTSNGTLQTIGPDFQYLRRYMDVLAYPPNPRQPITRRPTGAEQLGQDLFMNLPVQGSLTCASCHMLPTGASGEIVGESLGGVITSGDVPSLRAVGDKLSRPFDVGGEYGSRSELGAGLTHGGAIASIQESFDRVAGEIPGRHEFALAAGDAQRIAAFLSTFDTGIAPAAGLQVTANAANWGNVAANELPLLKAAAAQGDCELVYYRVPRPILGQMTEMNGLYDPASGLYRVASATTAPLDEATLLAEAAGGLPVTFLGVPIGMGESQGLDRDMDGLFDLDERVAQTDPEVWDTDVDHWADGYETRWGTDPLQANGSMPDTQPPALAGAVQLLYATTSSLKFEFETDEFCKVAVSYNGGLPVVRTPMNQIGDHHHWVTLGELQAGSEYRISLDMRDAVGNTFVDTSTVLRTLPRATPEPARVRTIDLSLVTLGPGQPGLHAEVKLYDTTASVGANYHVLASSYWKRADGSLQLLQADGGAMTDSAGIARFDVGLLPAGPTPGTIYFVVRKVIPPAGGLPWARGLDLETVDTLAY
jgi:hypothetical protein